MPTRRENSADAGAPAAEEPVPRDPRADHAARERRRWLDFRRAVREAKAAGAFAISAKGFKVWLQPPPTPPPSNSTTQDAATQQDARQEAQPSARKRRSAKRMQDFLLRKRLQQLAHCKLRHALLRAIRMLRWRRMQCVWTQWMRENSRAPAAVPMLLESSEQPAPPPAPPPKNKRGAEGTGILAGAGRAGERRGATLLPQYHRGQAAAPHVLDGGGRRRRRALIHQLRVDEGGRAQGRAPARRGLNATGLKSEMVAHLMAQALPPPT